MSIIVLFLIPITGVGAQETSEYDEITLENAQQLEQIASVKIESINDVAWSPDGTSIAAATLDGVYIYDWRSGAVTRLEQGKHVFRIIYVPGTSYFAVSLINEDETILFDAVTLQRVDEYVHAFWTISPDGSMYAANDFSSIGLYDLKTGKHFRDIPVGIDETCSFMCQPLDIAFSPDSRYLVYSSGVEEVAPAIVDLETGEKYSPEALGLGGFSFSPDSAFMASWAGSSGYLGDHILFIDGKTWKLNASIELYGTYTAPAISRDGRLLIANGYDDNAPNPDESPKMFYFFDTQQVMELHDTDKSIASSTVIRWGAVEITATILSADYHYLAVGDTEGQLSIWGVTTQNETPYPNPAVAVIARFPA